MEGRSLWRRLSMQLGHMDYRSSIITGTFCFLEPGYSYIRECRVTNEEAECFKFAGNYQRLDRWLFSQGVGVTNRCQRGEVSHCFHRSVKWFNENGYGEGRVLHGASQLEGRQEPIMRDIPTCFEFAMAPRYYRAARPDLFCE